MAENTRGSRRAGRIVVIGMKGRREYAGFLNQLIQLTGNVAEFPDIKSAISESDLLNRADVVVVLQSWSDQFCANDVNQLIGLTLFRRLLCCYSAKCESDGRNREIWPDAARIPLRLAASVLERELSDALRGEPALPPTAARDEIFSHRMGTDHDWVLPQKIQSLNAIVVSPDEALRRTIQDALKSASISCSSQTLLTHSDSANGGTVGPDPRVIIHDLDPWSTIVENSIGEARRRWPAANIFGLATMPDGGLTVEIADQQLSAVVPKLDLVNGLFRTLRQLQSA